jgi:hypothetical protein
MNIIHRFDRYLQQSFPQFYYSAIQKPRSFFRFKNERLLSRGISLSKNNHKSILFFTTQKCASRYVGQIIEQLAVAEGMITVDYDAYVTMAKVPKQFRPFSSAEARERAFQSKGYYFGPMGSYRKIPEMENYHVFLQFRDPRDVLTSLYFSTAYSHALINQKMVDRRKKAMAKTIDEYVLENAAQYERIYRQYCEILLGDPKILFLKYELMVAEFDNWINQLCEHLALTHHKDVVEAIKKKANFQVSGEDIYSQRRQVSPGDFRRKLKPKTIEQLNSSFSYVLEQLEYSKDLKT